ncbi:serine protease [Ensifer sp. NM-2]|uniref:S1 family peptidase n=1 Tax=Ensifer sp. NM-2 TaxID=2109730 RepID=UPI000D13AFA8|nr:serine protease [Ensifer sp. NM-2]PSS59881.1 serine protease [Ensifer sp. NM-2]
MSIYNQLPHTTSRIETTTANGGSVGTGFFFDIAVPSKGTMTCLVTNKHVMRGAETATIYMSRGGPTGPIFGTFNSWNITGNLADIVIGHPDPGVDLAIFPVGAILNEMAAAGTPPYYRAFEVSQIPSGQEEQGFTAIEDILMIGYPTGLWDQTNNLPIIRRGITATPYARNYNGRPEFMIDCACFPGSSGSPILIANEGSYSTQGSIVIGTRLHLLGLLWGGPQYTAQGKIVAQPVPTSMAPISLSQIPTNLGYCVKSKAIREMIPALLSRFG